LTKRDEIKKIVKAIATEDFESACEEEGFTIYHTAKENKSKKKANL